MSSYKMKRLSKGNELLKDLQVHLPEMYEAYRKFIALFAIALLSVLQVNLARIHKAFLSNA